MGALEKLLTHPTSPSVRPAVHGALLSLGSQPLATRFGPFTFHRFLHLASEVPVFALTRGPLRDPAPLLARVHSSCLTSEVLGACDCDCAAQLAAALEHIALEGRGAVFYLCQEGRGAGFVAKARDRMLVQASREKLTTFEAYDRLGLPHDSREYQDIASIRTILGIQAPLLLLSNSPDKLARLERAKVPIHDLVKVVTERSGFEGHYLEAKRQSGHALGRHGVPGPRYAMPRPVEVREPTPHPTLPGLLHLASYWLPVARNFEGEGGEAQWLNAEVWVDLVHGGDRVFLVGPGGPAGAQDWLRHDWLDRFPLDKAAPIGSAIRPGCSRSQKPAAARSASFARERRRLARPT